ncbi:hypothetical protein [Cryobacterium sp. MDB2-33-2]|uniref:hypothetical protein n=1 Tax=Cryobacterium sp. MDB2-33-2 TaxID=1259179 RepID=UPI001F547D36|nr:hypothetical protein [Cryobacterium sp. MDB2-33-2]
MVTEIKSTETLLWRFLIDSGRIETDESELTMATKTVRVTAADGRRIDVDQTMAMIEKGQQLAGHFPDAEALGRARRLLEGELTVAEGYAELDAKYSR